MDPEIWNGSLRPLSTDPDRERLLRTAKETNQARQVRARALRVHTLRLLAGGRRMLDDSREAVLAVADLDVAGLSENVDCRLACDGRRARAESERDLFLPVHQRRLPGSPRFASTEPRGTCSLRFGRPAPTSRFIPLKRLNLRRSRGLLLFVLHHLILVRAD